MTLVYRAPKLQPQQSLSDTPAPTAYNTISSPKPTKGSANFESKVPRKDQQCGSGHQVGPGSYFPMTEVEQKGPQSSMFSSKIERFKSPETKVKGNESSQSNFFDEVNEIMKKNHSPKHIPGKILTSKDQKAKEKEIVPQRLPSIPTHEQSYGYRYDGESNRLVNNDDPKIMFAKRGIVLEEDVYFQRAQSQLGKGPKCSLNSQVPRASPQLKHMLDLPDAGTYHPEKYTSIASNIKQMSNTVVSFREKFQHVSSNRQKLLMNKLKKQFRDYLHEDMSLSQLEREKAKCIERSREKEKSKEKDKNKEKRQFFMTKEGRFRVTKKTENKSAKTIKIQDPNSLISSQSSIYLTTNKKQPFSVGQTRFKQSTKQNLGPGSYEYSDPRSNSISILHKEQRFRDNINAINTPGPGAYDTTQKSKDEKVRTPFNRFVCHVLKEDAGQHQFSSMEDLYGKVGRHLNYLSKIQKIGNKNSQIQEKIKKQPNNKLMELSKLQKAIKKVVTDSNEKKPQDGNKNMHDRSHPKYQHLYEYKKPKETPSPLGPGCYEIAGSLDKKSFNQSPPPVYS